MDESPELRLLFHRLNNQLGIILAHAELLESKAPDDTNRARAAQVVSSALEAMGTVVRRHPGVRLLVAGRGDVDALRALVGEDLRSSVAVLG